MMSSKTVKGKDLNSLENLSLSLWMHFLMLPGMLSGVFCLFVSVVLFCFLNALPFPPLCDSLCELTALYFIEMRFTEHCIGQIIVLCFAGSLRTFSDMCIEMIQCCTPSTSVSLDVFIYWSHFLNMVISLV